MKKGNENRIVRKVVEKESEICPDLIPSLTFCKIFPCLMLAMGLNAHCHDESLWRAAQLYLWEPEFCSLFPQIVQCFLKKGIGTGLLVPNVPVLLQSWAGTYFVYYLFR